VEPAGCPATRSVTPLITVAATRRSTPTRWRTSSTGRKGSNARCHREPSGENLTTLGVDLTATRIGTRYRVGDTLLLEVSAPRIPCRTFADWLGETGWVKTFTADGRPGTCLRVIEPEPVQANDPLRVGYVPDHEITVGFAFRALTTQRELLPTLAHVAALPSEERDRAQRAADG